MEVTGAAERPSARGPDEWFTGEVWMDEIASLPGPGPVRALRVHFTPGARTAWHVHPLGQVLHIVEGFSFREVGKLTGVSLFTAAARYRLAVGRLRKVLSRSRRDTT